MRRSEVSHRRNTTVTPVEPRSSHKKSNIDLRSRSSCTARHPTIEELEEAACPMLGFTPDQALLPRPRQRRPFLHGPLDWGEVCLAATISREVLAVWLLIHLRRKLTGELWVTLPARELARLRVVRQAKHRALKALEGEGLVRVQRVRGCTTRVSLVRE